MDHLTEGMSNIHGIEVVLMGKFSLLPKRKAGNNAAYRTRKGQ